MGTRGEIFTKPIKAKNRTYFFNVKENTRGDVFLQIVESKESDGLGFERRSVVIFEDELKSFLAGLDESLQFIEKNQKMKSKQRFKKLQATKNSSVDRSTNKQTDNPANLFKKKRKRKIVRSNPHK